jgi:hypothetical protein
VRRQTDLLARVRGLAADREDAIDAPTQPREQLEHGFRIQIVCVPAPRAPRDLPQRPASPARRSTRYQALPVRHRVDEDQRVVAVEQLVGEVHAADARVHHARASGSFERKSWLHHLDSERIVAEEQDCRPGHEHSSRSSLIGTTSSGKK